MKITVDGRTIDAAEGMTILEAARQNGIHIPSLCWLKNTNSPAACRVCVVQVKGRKGNVPSCVTKISEGMEIVTDSPEIRSARRRSLELIAADHRMDCTECGRGSDCELRELLQEYHCDDRFYGSGTRKRLTDESTEHLIRDNSRCIICRRCVSVCAKVQGVRAISVQNKGSETQVGFAVRLADTDCIHCGQCIAACPTGALQVTDSTRPVWKAIYDKETAVVFGISPYTVLRLGELFGEEKCTDVSGKITSILKKIGADYVVDTSVLDDEYDRMVMQSAEAAVKENDIAVFGGCPAVERYICNLKPEWKKYYVKQPLKQVWFAEQCRKQLKDRKVFYVNVDNCTALKAEITKEENKAVDAAITTRELFYMIRRACVSNFTANQVWKQIEPEPFDALFAGRQSCASEYREVQDSCMDKDSGTLITVSGMNHARELMETLTGKNYVRILACPGGCMNGGGAPGSRSSVLY